MSLNYREKDALSNHIILIFLTLVILIPIIILLFNSVKPKAEFGFSPLGFPNEIRLMNYIFIQAKLVTKPATGPIIALFKQR